MIDPLYLAQVRLPLPGISRWSEQRGLGGADLGYQLHAVLTGLFGEKSPKPFRVKGVSANRVEVLGYVTLGAGPLREQAQWTAEPELFALLESGEILTKALPATIPQGRRLGFAVNLCPLVRKHADGHETDPFHLRKVRGEVGEENREEVYLAWFRETWERQGGAQLRHVEIDAMKGVRLWRRDRNRKMIATDRREVLFAGGLEVAEPEAFYQMLVRGVGRHRAFGFGMLLLNSR